MDVLPTLTAGAISGALADAITHPISTVKARLQVQGAAGGATSSSIVKYTSTYHCLRTMIRSEGPAALYTGVGAVLAGAAPGQALYFLGYEAAKSVLPPDNSVASFACGFLAQLFGSIAWVPMDVVKERLQVQGAMKSGLTAKYQGSAAALREIIASEGVRGLYRAYWIHQMTWAPFNGLYFMVYETTKKELKERDLVEWPALPVAGIIAAGTTNPADLVKTRMQVAAANPSLFDYKNSSDCLKKVVKREGVMALFDGVGSRILLLTPRLSIAVGIYEIVRNRLAST